MKKKRPSNESKLGSDVDGGDEENEDEEYEEKKPPKGRKTTRKASGTTTRPARGSTRSRVAKKATPEVEVDESESGGEPELVSKASEAMDDDNENTVPVRRSRQGLLAKKSGRSKTAKVATSEKQPEVMEEEEEEKSLFDPLPPASVPMAQPQTTVAPEPEGPKARLVIHKLVLVNFKSYGGRQEIGPFHESFSSIVGPNGSRKSNTIDALLFVFGYRATKMRQGKLGESIHNSARYPDLQECRVEIYFREITDLPGPDEFEIVPESELVVARHAYKNNTSKYMINGRQSSFTEVQTLLKGRGIDLDHKRFLILQGEVESIALMKPKATSEHDEGLLEYLEDIIGTAHFKEPIQEAMDELERLNDSRQEKLTRLRLVEKENSLEAKRKEAIEFQKLWKRARLEELEEELEQEKAKNKDDVNHLELLEKHYRDREAAYKELQKAATAAQKDLAEQEKKEVGVNERKKHAEGKVKKHSKLVMEENNSLRSAKQTIEDSTQRIEKGKDKLQEHEESLVKEEKALAKIQDSLKDKTKVYYDQKEVLQRELQPWNTKINATQSEFDIATSERDAVFSKAEQAKQAQEEADMKLETLKSEMEQKVERQAQLKAQKVGLDRDKEALAKKIQDTQEDVGKCNRKVASSNAKVSEAKASQAENRSQNRVLTGLNGLRDSGSSRKPWTIPDQYDVAISTACPQLHHMVVDTVEQAQQGIEYLRTNNLGRASFMVLDKCQYRPEAMQQKPTPENVPRLFDLIAIKDDKFRPAFYKALADTLVAQDVTQANRIAFGEKRWRVVTLTGQLIDLSGTMSGGGRNQARGAMSSKFSAEAVRPDVMRKLEKESQDAEVELQEKMTELKSAQDQLSAAKKKVPEIEMEYVKLGMEIQTGKTRVAEAEMTAAALKKQNKFDASATARIAELEKSIKKAKTELDRLTEKAEKINAELNKIDEKILEIGGSNLMAQKSKVDGLKNYIDLTNDAIT
ncbi:hypothetical protein E1B28_004996 [Marasmius oreades]|uniref:SMC hinge domain-containing protein n=1 Tax=Marasmius oreades TaxID=181124 RepID=A0A9P7UZY5_9AGAR|nr:uncharacterized protein E1B28_004996 [Marasmius oreades]KAG7097670.1 hypothetical protein E1B28_004996 [Marasmius oreades]